MSEHERIADDFVVNGAFVQREYLGRSQSYGLAGAPTEIYVFDTNVIKAACAPWAKGPRIPNDPQTGLGVVFEDSAPEHSDFERRKAQKLCLALAEHALGLQKRHGILQFEAHAKETNRVFRAVRRTFENYENTDSFRSQARSSFLLTRMLVSVRLAAADGLSMAEAAPYLDTIVNLIIDGDDQRSPRMRSVAEWDNYVSLETRFGGIFSVDRGVERPAFAGLLAKAVSVLQEAGRSPQEAEAALVVQEHFEAVFRRNGIAGDNDRDALTDLFLLNCRLQRQDVRCVFVTGDRQLAEAAYESIDTSRLDPAFHDIAKHFSKRYVRHLWAYLSDAVIDPTEKDKFLGMFGGLVAGYSSEPDVTPAEVRRLLNRKTRPAPISEVEVDEVLLNWANLTRKSVGTTLLDSAMREAVWNRMKEVSQHRSWDELVTLLREDVARIRDRTLLSISDIGIDAIIATHRLPRRNPPDLMFESLKNTNLIFKRLSTVAGYGDEKAFAKDFGNIGADCHDASKDGDDRQESHLKFLVLGAAFASADRWLVALGHARRAASIINRYKDPIPVRPPAPGQPESFMSGREAFFLEAVSRRVLADREEELVDARVALDKHLAALKLDHKHGTGKSVTDLRYRNEILALAFSRYYLRRMRSEENFQDDLVDTIYSAANELLPTFDQWSHANPPEDGHVTMVSISTNVVQTFVVGQFRVHHGREAAGYCPVGLDHVAKATKWVHQLTNWDRTRNVGDLVTATPLISAYAAVGQMFVEGKKNLTASYIRDKLERYLGTDVTRYDNWRFRKLLEFAFITFA